MFTEAIHTRVLFTGEKVPKVNNKNIQILFDIYGASFDHILHTARQLMQDLQDYYGGGTKWSFSFDINEVGGKKWIMSN